MAMSPITDVTRRSADLLVSIDEPQSMNLELFQ